MRKAEIARKTAETDISLALELDGTGVSDISTGIGFFDHMLTLFAKHSLIDLTVCTKGDLDVDAHHSVEDTGICLGQALGKAMGDKAGIRRYGTAYIPMDEALVRCSMDCSGRGFLVYKAPDMQYNDAFDPQLCEEFFRSVAANAGITLHLEVLYGKNTHHIIEAMFKAFARALRTALEKDERQQGIPSSKGVL